MTRKTLKTKKVKVVFYAMLPDFRKNISFWKLPKALPICPSGNSNVQIKMNMEDW